MGIVALFLYSDVSLNTISTSWPFLHALCVDLQPYDLLFGCLHSQEDVLHKAASMCKPP